MMPNLFAEILQLQEADISELKRLIQNNIAQIGNNNDQIGLYSAIQKLWMYNFFHNGSGYDAYQPYLRRVFEDLSLDNPEQYLKQCVDYFQRNYCGNRRLGDWFYKNCWMISGEIDRNGHTSGMPRAVLQYYDDYKDQRGYEEEEYDDYPHFQLLHSDVEARDNFWKILGNLNYYQVLSEAMERFRKKARAECGWYLEKNGDHFELILGIKRIRLANNDHNDTIKITISAEHSNEKVEKKIAKGHDSMSIAIAELITFADKGKLTVKINGSLIDKIKLDEVVRRFSGDSPLPVCFKCPANSNSRWFKLLPQYDPQAKPYNKSTIWIVSAKRLNQNTAVWTIHVRDKTFYCQRQELDLKDDITFFQYKKDNQDIILFSYQRADDYIDFSGDRDDVYDDAHKWIIFSGDELALTGQDENVWSHERNNGYDVHGAIIHIKPSSCDHVQQFEVYRTYAGGERARKFTILFIPEKFINKCRNMESWIDDKWSYNPERTCHPEIRKHIQGGFFGDILLDNQFFLKLFTSVDTSKDKAFFWLKKQWQDIDELSENESKIHDFGSYGEMNEYSLCFVEENNPSFVVRMHDGQEKELNIPPLPSTHYNYINLSQFTDAVHPSIAQNKYDEIHYNGQLLFKVGCYPTSPQIFLEQDLWKVYMPATQRQNYGLLILSEKALESMKDFVYISCQNWNDEIFTISDEYANDKLGQKPHAIYATLIDRSLTNNRDIKYMFDFIGNAKDFSWVKIREATELNCRNLFSNKMVLEILLNEYHLGSIFRSAQEYVTYPDVNGSLDDFWKKYAGYRNSPFSIPYLLKIMLDNGFNFLAEPGKEQMTINGCKSNYKSTWLSQAFRNAMINWRDTPTRIMTTFMNFSKNREAPEPNVGKYEDFLKIFIENQDSRCLRDNREKMVHGVGWLPVALFQYLLEKKSFGTSDILNDDDSTQRNIIGKLEKSGLRELTTVSQFPRIWNFQLRCNRYVFQPYCPPTNRISDNNVCVCMPGRNVFLNSQAKLFNDRLYYLNDKEGKQLYNDDTYDKTCQLLVNLLDRLDEQQPRQLALHLSRCFRWILENIRNLVEAKEEDLNHAVLGITAIACRIAAQFGYHDDEILLPDDRNLLLSNVKKAFDIKYDNQTCSANNDDFTFCGDCWRFLMYYIPPVDLALWFYNSWLEKNDTVQKENN